MKRQRDDAGPEDAGKEDGPTMVAAAGASSSAQPSAAQLASRSALAALPCAEMYEKSFMHRDHVTHIVCTASDFIITGSRDGQVKFWKKMQVGIEFVKHFRAHLAPIAGFAATPDGSLLATTAGDKAFKVFDVLSFDMITWATLEFMPGACEWIGGSGGQSRSKPLLAVADANSPPIRLFDAASDASGTAVKVLNIHTAPVVQIKLNAAKDVLVSCDTRGVIEYWNAEGGAASGTSFRFKTETDLYAMAKAKATPLALAISPDGEHFAITASDAKVRLFRWASGKLLRSFDEGYDAMNALQKGGDDAFRLEAFDFGRRMAVEREYRAALAAPAATASSAASAAASNGTPPTNVLFDASGRYLIYPSVVGIKVISVATSKLARLLGKVENTERFACLALFQGRAKLGANMIGSGVKVTEEEDPTLFCAAFKKSRFYLFTRREPAEPEGDDQQGRDIFNEKPSKEDLALAEREAKGPLPRIATINTSYGEIRLKLFPDECPKTVENFATHAANGYYDGVIFHRVIKGFMVQTGDPFGDGTGGTSIWGHEFEDEFHRSLRHDRPFTLSMANAGPGTNGSQFFITTAPAPWLDNKHTVFGRVEKGMDVVQGIEKVKCNKDDKPLMDIKILSIVTMHAN